jgi:hypothetical protein
LAGTTERVSVTSNGDEVSGHSFAGVPGVSRGGEVVSFVTDAADLDAADSEPDSDVYVRERGPEIGVSGLVTKGDASGVTVSGRATFSGISISEASDPGGDGASIGPVPAAEIGGELTGAAMTYRPESQDVLVRWRLAGLPSAHVPPGAPEVGVVGAGLAPGVAGAPGLVYELEVSVAGVAFEVRGSRVSATAGAPLPHAFALFRCTAASCERVARLNGEIGQTGTSASAVIPLSALDAGPTSTLEAPRAVAGIGELATGIIREIDQAALPQASLPQSTVTSALTPAGGQPGEEAFVETHPVGGRFSATHAPPDLQPGSYAIWVRACLGAVCSTASVPVVVPGAES